MDDAVVSVHPIGPGWMVEGGLLLEPLLFLSGAKAEAQAHAIARGLASAGLDAGVLVHDRTQEMVGRFRYRAWAQAGG